MATEQRLWDFIKNDLDTMKLYDFLEKINLEEMFNASGIGMATTIMECVKSGQGLSKQGERVVDLHNNIKKLLDIRNQMREENVHVGFLEPSPTDTPDEIISKMTKITSETAGVPVFKHMNIDVATTEDGKYEITVDFVTFDNRKFWMNTRN